jgi:hypothetical protein
MKKVFLAICIAAISSSAYSQKGNNQIGVGVDLGLPMGDFGDFSSFGVGGYVKGLYGIGTAGQITLTTGYQSYAAKKEIKDALGADKYNLTIIPVLVGYRHNFSGFYVEPQVGYGSYGSKVKISGVSGNASSGAFTYALGLGYAKSGFDGGVRYQAGSKDGSTTSLIGIHIGYNFSLGGE